MALALPVIALALAPAAHATAAPLAATAAAPAPLVGVLTNPVVAVLLCTVAVWLVIADLTTGGVGVASAAAAAVFTVFFWAHAAVGMSGWGEVALVAGGLALIALELLVIPGVGLPGIVGLTMLLGGLFLTLSGGDAGGLARAAVSVAVILLAAIAGLILAVRLLARRGAPPTLVLDTQLGGGAPVTERTRRGWVRWFGGDDLVLERGAREAGAEDDWFDERLVLDGHQGTALSYLRPAGIAEIDGHRVDVITEGEYIAAGDRIEVLSDDGYRRVVRRVPDHPDGPPA